MTNDCQTFILPFSYFITNVIPTWTSNIECYPLQGLCCQNHYHKNHWKNSAKRLCHKWWQVFVCWNWQCFYIRHIGFNQLYNTLQEKARNQKVGSSIKLQISKGQLISKCPFVVIFWTKNTTKKIQNFCPYFLIWPLFRG